MSQNTKKQATEVEKEILDQLKLVNYNYEDLKEIRKLDHGLNKVENCIALQEGRINVVETKQEHQQEKIGNIEKTTHKMFDRIDEINKNVLEGQKKQFEENKIISRQNLEFKKDTLDKIAKYLWIAFTFSAIIAGSIGLLYKLFFSEMKEMAVREQNTSEKLIETLKLEMKSISGDTTVKKH